MKQTSPSFLTWLSRERYTIILTIVCSLLSIVGSIASYIDKAWPIIKELPEISNILFILFSLFALSDIGIRIRGDEGQKSYLFKYAKDSFGANSELCRYGEDNLFNRMNICINRFYFSWIAVWLMWLAMYISKFIFGLVAESIPNNLADIVCRNYYFANNLLDLLVSLVFVFIYMSLSYSNVNMKSPDTSRRSIHIGTVVLFFVAVVLLLTDYYSMKLPDNDSYFYLQYWLQTIISLIATISFMMVLGKLNSGYLNVPQWLFISLYLYAATQMLYPILDNEHAVTIKLLDGNIKYFQHITNAIAFFGKVCLLILIRWVAIDRRFLFYLVHKTNEMAEASDMQVDFCRVYDKK